jgi:tRNA pseudouridine55 synthase
VSADGLLVVDKPAGLTSHAVVSRVRKAMSTRKVGHAGTLDPMATGVLVLGVGRATRLLTMLTGADKSYEATIRLGWSTTTDDAEGDLLGHIRDARDITAASVADCLSAFTGTISQVPSTISAIKVDGKRAHARARAGEEVVLAARQVVVSRFDVTSEMRPNGDGSVDFDVAVDCSSGTYIRALARDLGDVLGVGGHLASLRRTRVGPFSLEDAVALEGVLPADLRPMGDSAKRFIPWSQVDGEAANLIAHGVRIEWPREGSSAEHCADASQIAIIGEQGQLIAVASVGAKLRYDAVFV